MSTGGGLRERKKQRTKETIQREAMRLFKKHGYEETTIEQIAAAAEISPSTFFNYFPSKEDVVLFDQYDPMVLAILASGPPGETLSQAVRRTLAGLAGVFERDRETILERSRLWLEVPELRGRIWEELEKARDLFCTIIAGRTGHEAADFDVQIVSITLVAIAFQASAEWAQSGGRGSMLDLFMKAMDLVDFNSLMDRVEASGAQPA